MNIGLQFDSNRFVRCTNSRSPRLGNRSTSRSRESLSKLFSLGVADNSSSDPQFFDPFETLLLFLCICGVNWGKPLSLCSILLDYSC